MNGQLYKSPERSKPFRQLGKLLLAATVLLLVLHTALSTWAALELARAAGRWFGELGQPMFSAFGYPVMKPWAWVLWDSRLSEVAALRSILSKVQLMAVASVFLFFPLRLLVRPKYHNADVHGSARWATKDEIVTMGLLGKGE